MAQVRSVAANTSVCLNDAATLFAIPQTAGQASGKYYVADGTGAIYVFVSKNAAPLTYSPIRGQGVNVTGNLSVFQSQEEIGNTTSYPTFSQPSSGAAMPTPVTPRNASYLDDSNANSDQMVGQYVQVPPDNYAVDSQPAELKYTSPMDGGTVSYDGVKLTSPAGDKILVETYTFSAATRNACPSPSFARGSFKGVFDRMQTTDGNVHKVLVFGDCNDL